MKLRRSLFVVLAIIGIYLLGVPLLFHNNNYVLHVFIICSQVSIVALTVRLVYLTGELTFGQVAYVMIGAYASAILSSRYGVAVWLCPPLSGLVGATIAFVLGFAIMRLRGTYFAILSLIVAEFMKQAARTFDFIGGSQGYYGIPRPEAIQIGSLTIVPAFNDQDRLPYFALVALMLIVTVLVFNRIEQSPLGWRFKAVNQDDSLSASLGINTLLHRVIVYAIAAFFASTVGSFSAHYMTVFYPESFTVWDSIHYVLYAFIGGMAYLGGPIVGTFGLTWLWEALHSAAEWQMIIFAAIVVCTTLFVPGGLFSLPERIRPLFSKYSRHVYSGSGKESQDEYPSS